MEIVELVSEFFNVQIDFFEKHGWIETTGPQLLN